MVPGTMVESATCLLKLLVVPRPLLAGVSEVHVAAPAPAADTTLMRLTLIKPVKTDCVRKMVPVPELAFCTAQAVKLVAPEKTLRVCEPFCSP